MTVHVVGMGMAGLSASVYLASRGVSVVCHEASWFAGGRCRSFYDKRLGCVIDNGNHLILSGNRSISSYIDMVGARDRFRILPPCFRFVDVRDGKRWQVRPNWGYIPWWIFFPSRRPYGVGLTEMLRLCRFMSVRSDLSVGDYVRGSSADSREYFWDPLVISLLNTPTDVAGASLMSAVMREIFIFGGSAWCPLLSPRGLSWSLVDSGIEVLSRHGSELRFHSRLLRVTCDGDCLRVLHFSDGDCVLSSDDGVIFCVPPHVISSFFPDILVPRGGNVIVNVHYRYGDGSEDFLDDGFVGVVGGTAHWFFVRGGVLSATISAAGAYDGCDNDALARLIWSDAARIFDLDVGVVPPFRVIRERRATYNQTPPEIARRPHFRTRYRNVFLSGDWVSTGLPATIESAVRSGMTASRGILSLVA